MNELSEYKVARHAVCFLLMNDKGEVLAISRGNDTTAWGLPGGKVEANESLDVAVVRETYEETGYVIAAPQSVYTAFVPGETNFVCTTFIAHVVAQAPDAPRSDPFEGEVQWVHPRVVAKGPFAEYNQALFAHLNIGWTE
jgi:8-oxo-dGTP pyrophosphatase MutT (NUDIX family)